MSERGSTGASSRSTTRPSASSLSRLWIVQFAAPRTTRPARTAMTLRTWRLLSFRPPAVQREARREERRAGADEQHRFLEQSCMQRVVVMREVAEQREDAEPGEHAVAVGVADDEDCGRGPDAGRLERHKRDDRRARERDPPRTRAERDALAPEELHHRPQR